MRRRVTETSKTPSNQRNFVRDDNTKTKLYHFLADTICEVQKKITNIVTKGEDVISMQP